MNTLVEIFMWIYLIIGIIVVTSGILALFLNLIAYAYQSFIGFKTFRKFLKKYHSEMKEYREEKEIQEVENILSSVSIKKNKRIRAVKQFDENNNFIREYKSIAEASKHTGITEPAICKTCKGQQKMASGYIWRYANE